MTLNLGRLFDPVFTSRSMGRRLGLAAASAQGEPGLDLHLFAGVLVALLCSGLVLWLKASERRRTAALEAANEALRREVAERRRAEEVLRASEARLQTLVHHFPNGGVFLFDHELRYLVADGRGLAKVGLMPDMMVGKRIDELLDPETYAVVEPLYRATLEDRAPAELELGYAGRLYRVFPVALRGDDGAVAAGMVINIDITEAKRDQEERRRMEQKLQEKQRLESLGVLASGLAHDFNNLLAAILGNAELLRLDLPARSPSQANVDAVIAVTRRASELVQQMLAYAGKRRIIRQPLSLNVVIRELGELLRASLEKHGRVFYDLGEPLPAVAGDASQLRQIVMSLLVNASEAIVPETGGTITVSTEALELGAADVARLASGAELAPGRYVRLTVTDTGCGMDSETLARIFDPFFTTKFIGRGLGLAAVHGIVRSHGGALAVESEPGRGTTFRVWLPATEAAPAPLRAALERG
ncbi:MAG TPA: ATP-binding protein [Candidatus Nanopelagicales bacterium]|nr:ATP-binding protein [Candidatus Nanopelagicales bacterium]